jgi:Uma2 family endonuclease
VQPDLVFIAAERLHICTDRVWGAPGLAIEVLSVGTARHDSTAKLSWFQRYGVRECWPVDPAQRKAYVVSLTQASRSTVSYGEEKRIRSSVLPQLDLRVGDLFT